MMTIFTGNRYLGRNVAAAETSTFKDTTKTRAQISLDRLLVGMKVPNIEPPGEGG